mmetsp:Transcript_322/g.1128  ORF Transcript_322/g.1128 Transcript_322/m.1128 type:complete len:226 (-) Transcript_322:114-791(-)
MTYNWYEPGAKLGRHLDEHHEETKGPKGWTVPTRRSVTWLVYLNDEWQANEGGALRTYPRAAPAAAPVGAHMGNLQVGWIGGTLPVFLDAATRDDGLLFLYSCGAGGLVTLLSDAFPMPPKPVEFGRFISKAPPGTDFEQISTARLDPRFAGSGAEPLRPSTQPEPLGQLDILPVGGTLVLFDSVTLPHQVLEVTARRPRLATTGWFHEDSQLFIPPFPQGQPGV